MSAITLDLPDDLAQRLQGQRDLLPEILERGLRDLNSVAFGGPESFGDASEVLEFLASLPTPEETLKLKPSTRLSARVTSLLEKNRSEGLTAGEQEEWDRYELVEHLVRIAKSKAIAKLTAAKSANG